MMQPQLLEPSWPLYNIMNPTLDQPTQFEVSDHEFSPVIITGEDSFVNSSDSYISALSSNEFVEFVNLDDEIQNMLAMENIVQTMDGLEAISDDEIEDVYGWLNNDEGEGSFCSNVFVEEEGVLSADLSIKKSYDASEFSPSVNQSLILPSDDMEIDSQLSLSHLLTAYAEAMDEGQPQLAEVMVGCINEKASPVGETLERVAFNLFQPIEKQSEFIKNELSKNMDSAFRAFYEIFPYGRLPHFVADLTILEAMPADAETIHIVDFDLGAGIQWPQIIEAVGSQHKVLKLTSIKEEDNCDRGSSGWKFEETKWRLHEYARSFGLKIKIEEKSLGEFVNDIHESRTKNGREWLAFNCMTNLPHMGRRRSRSDVLEFLRVARLVLASPANYYKGILTFGHGEDGEMMRNLPTYSSFFSENLRYYQALYESMECSFPAHLAEARLTMESLFLTPYASPMSCYQRWEEITNFPVFDIGTPLQGRSLSTRNLMEAKEMVKEGVSLYKIRTEGRDENEMILEWRGSPLVRISSWM